MNIDNIDKNLLNIIQAEFPFSREPFTTLGLRLNLNSDGIIRRIERLKAEGIIRLIGPIFNPKRLGYRTTLIAMQMPAKLLDEAGHIICTNSMVSHCYERDHQFNLWFTLAIPTANNMDTEVNKLASKIKPKATLNLPALQTFKIGAYFNIDDNTISASRDIIKKNKLSDTDLRLSATERAIINELQEDMPLTEKPFDQIAARLSMNTDEFINSCQALLRRGIMRRFSASVSHTKIGFKANAMTCWKVVPDMVVAAGKGIAEFPEVSHCYERQTNYVWHHNMFAMIHGATRETCRAIADKICSEIGLVKYEMLLLFSTKEIKKTRVKYTV